MKIVWKSLVFFTLSVTLNLIEPQLNIIQQLLIVGAVMAAYCIWDMIEEIT